MRTLYKNGTFLSMNQNNDIYEAILAEDGIIIDCGNEDEVCERSQNYNVLDMGGKVISPAFIDAHSHLTAVAYRLLIADLNPPPAGACNCIEDMITALREKKDTLKEGQWLLGMGYDESVLTEKRHPAKEDLDQVSTEIPVLAIHTSGHLCVANTKALELLGYTGDFEIPQGGAVQASGLIKEQAYLSPEKQKLIQGPSEEEVIKAIGDAVKKYKNAGIHTIQDARCGMGEYQMLKAADERGLIDADVVLYFTYNAAKKYLPSQMPDLNTYEGHIRPAGLKLFLDGSPQGKTAWLSKPYFVPPEGEEETYHGFPIYKDNVLIDIMMDAVHRKWQINVHANGDEAIEQMIRCYAKALELTGSTDELRPVVIHCQTVRTDQLERMRELGMMPSYFADHVYYWGDYHRDSVLGKERAENISPLKTTLEMGIPFTLHRDSPVLMPDVKESIQIASERVTSSGKALGPEERISRYEALRAVTANAAYQIFEEAHKGTLEKGKKMDYVILQREHDDPIL